MFNEHDLRQIHGYMENPFPRIRPEPIATTNPTEMNNIVPIIPEPARSIMDLTLLLTGANLNALLGLVIVLNSSMYTSANCYIMSLVCSNLAILFEPLQRVLQTLDVNLEMNLDYIFLVTFETSILSITTLNIETYVVVCQKNSSLRVSLLKISTAVKGILLIWIMCIMLTAMELRMYDHFERKIIYDIYVLSTVMFLIFPCIVFIMLDYYILCNLIISKSINGTWLSEDVERFLLLVGITIGFFLTMIPYRIVRAIALVTSFCCSDMMIEVVYTMVKIYPMILPITCFVISKKFRHALQVTLHCRRHESP